MKKFSYRNAVNLQEALSVLSEEKESAFVVAGATNVLLNIRSGKRTEGTLVNISNIGALRGITLHGDTITVGALTTICDIEKSDILMDFAPALWEISQSFADPSTRNSATIGGNICNASPAADSAVPLLALDAVLTLEKKGESRELPITDFFKDKGQTTLKPDELLTKIRFKKAPNSSYRKLGGRNAMSIAAANFAVALTPDGEKIKNVRIATGCLSPYPSRAEATEKFVEGQKLTDDLLSKIGEVLNNDIEPHSGLRASEEYRRAVAPVFICRLLKKAYSVDGGENNE